MTAVFDGPGFEPWPSLFCPNGHRWDIYYADRVRHGFIGSRRRCLDCGQTEVAFLDGYGDERRDRIAHRLTVRYGGLGR